MFVSLSPELILCWLKVCLVKAMVFSSSHVWMWELDREEGRAPKNWCFLSVVLEKALESPLDYKEIQPVHSEGDQPWDFFGRNDVKAETPVFGHLMWRVDSLEKTLMLGGIGGRRRKGRPRMRWLDGITGSWWWTGRPGMLRFMGLQRVRHTWATELNWTELNWTEQRNTLKRPIFVIGFLWLHLTRRLMSFVTFRLVKMKMNLSLRTRWCHPL